MPVGINSVSNPFNAIASIKVPTSPSPKLNKIMIGTEKWKIDRMITEVIVIAIKHASEPSIVFCFIGPNL